MEVLAMPVHADYRQPERTRAITPSRFPRDAHALISQAVRSPTTSRRPTKKKWKLTFERHFQLRIEPLMGWTEDEDPLAQIELSFSSAEAAIAYARRHGLQYTVLGSPQRNPNLRLIGDKDPNAAVPTTRPKRRGLESTERTLESEQATADHPRTYQGAEATPDKVA
jgi:hypothetical protein